MKNLPILLVLCGMFAQGHASLGHPANEPVKKKNSLCERCKAFQLLHDMEVGLKEKMVSWACEEDAEAPKIGRAPGSLVQMMTRLIEQPIISDNEVQQTPEDHGRDNEKQQRRRTLRNGATRTAQQHTGARYRSNHPSQNKNRSNHSSSSNQKHTSSSGFGYALLGAVVFYWAVCRCNKCFWDRVRVSDPALMDDDELAEAYEAGRLEIRLDPSADPVPLVLSTAVKAKGAVVQAVPAPAARRQAPPAPPPLACPRPPPVGGGGGPRRARRGRKDLLRRATPLAGSPVPVCEAQRARSLWAEEDPTGEILAALYRLEERALGAVAAAAAAAGKAAATDAAAAAVASVEGLPQDEEEVRIGGTVRHVAEWVEQVVAFFVELELVSTASVRAECTGEEGREEEKKEEEEHTSHDSIGPTLDVHSLGLLNQFKEQVNKILMALEDVLGDDSLLARGSGSCSSRAAEEECEDSGPCGDGGHGREEGEGAAAAAAARALGGQEEEVAARLWVAQVLFAELVAVLRPVVVAAAAAGGRAVAEEGGGRLQ